MAYPYRSAGLVLACFQTDFIQPFTLPPQMGSLVPHPSSSRCESFKLLVSRPTIVTLLLSSSLRRAIEQTRNDRRYWPVFFAHTFGPIVYRSRRQAMEQTIGVILERYESSLLSLAHSNANYRQRERSPSCLTTRHHSSHLFLSGRQEQERDALYLCNKDELSSPVPLFVISITISSDCLSLQVHRTVSRVL